MSADDAIPDLARGIRRDRIARARRMSFAQKFLSGGELFDDACEITKSGIRNQHPDWTETQVLDELRRRLAMRKARELRPLTNPQTP